MSDERYTNPLLKEVPTHLFHFEEKIFGMTLPQLLSDVAGGLVIASLTTPLPAMPRLVIGGIAGLLLLVLVHVRIGGYPMLVWLSLLLRFATTPKETVWRAAGTPRVKGEPKGIQDTWLPLSTLTHGVMGHSIWRKQHSEMYYWVAFQVETPQNVRFLADTEQERFFSRVKSFLDGLGFPVKFISLVENSDPASDPALLAQQQAAAALAPFPHLQRLQQASLATQRTAFTACTRTRHYLIVAANSRDVITSRPESAFRSPLSTLMTLTFAKKGRSVTGEQVLDLLRIRISIIKKALAGLDVRATLLADAEILQAHASALALGISIPSYEIEICGEAEEHPSSAHEEICEQDLPKRPGRGEQVSGGEPSAPADEQGTPHVPAQPRTRAGRKRWKKRVRGLHRTFAYTSTQRHPRFEAGVLTLSDLLAPTAITIQKDAVVVDVRGEKRYQRYFEVLGYGSDLLCGWQEELTALGLPMLVMTKCEPLDSRAMIRKLEFHLTKLESSRISDQKHKRRTSADQTIEDEQVRAVVNALARKKLRIFAVQMVIGIHAGSKERLEQRSDYLLSHLRDMQLSVRALSRRHDVAWQACLPWCMEYGLDYYTNLPSDVLSTFMSWSTGGIGTTTGAYLGTTGSGFNKQPVYLNPWDPKKRLPNPHVTICGESGMGKSWLLKLIILGLICNLIADAVVMDRDGDYDEIHRFLGNASQRFNLAGSIPINLLDIPYGPADVDLEEKTDLLAEFIDNHLLVGLALLYGETLSKAQEAFLTAAAREAYSRRGITMEAIWRDPKTLLAEPPTFSELIAAMKEIPASSEAVRLPLIERFENVSYLFPGQTSVRIDTPLTIFNINKLDEKWYPLMVYVIQTFLMRHRALKRDERYLAYVIEEASYMLKHAAGKRYLESGSRGFRKLGIAQFVVSQHPADFLEEGQVILSNSATNIFLGMQRYAAQKLGLAEELERVIEEGVFGRAVMRCGREYAALDVSRGSPLHRALLTTDPVERRRLHQRKQQVKPPQQVVAS